jgi:hypothetical protein
MALCTTESGGIILLGRYPRTGKASAYGYEHRLSQHFCRLNFNGGNVSNLQNEFVQDKSGELQIANHVSCVPRRYGTGRGQLPALRKAAAHGMNRGKALPCLGFHDVRRSAIRVSSIPLKRFKGEKHEHHTNSYFRARHRAGDKSQGGEKVCTNERDEQIRGSTAG